MLLNDWLKLLQSGIDRRRHSTVRTRHFGRGHSWNAVAGVHRCVEVLEDRTLLAADLSGLADFGDYYWVDGEQVPLFRLEGEGLLLTDAVVEAQSVLWSESDYTAVSGLNSSTGLSSPDGQTVGWVSPALRTADSPLRVWLTDEIIIRLSSEHDLDEVISSDASIATSSLLAGTPDQYVLTVEGTGLEALEAANHLHESGLVTWATPNFIAEAQATAATNDSLLSLQWHLNNTGQSGGTSDADIDAFEAWDITTGSSDVVIAIFDSGVDLGHPDLAANIWTNPGEIAGNGIDDDGNGWIDDIHGIDVSPDATGTNGSSKYDNDPSPFNAFDNHGTAVAGAAAAVGNNATGVAGVAHSSKILPIKPFRTTNSSGSLSLSYNDLAAAIYYAAGRTFDGLGTWRGADVSNHSWGGGPANQAVIDAFAWAEQNGRGGKGQASFVSTGNDSTGLISFPSSLSSTIAVGASDHNDTRASYSNYGSGIDFVAPGGTSSGSAWYYTTDRSGASGYVSGNYVGITGTSFSAPTAAGIGALVLSVNPNLTASELRSLLRDTADKTGGYIYIGGFNSQMGYGRLNAFAAVQAAADFSVTGNGVEIVDGDTTPSTTDHTDFGSVSFGATAITRTFTVTNDGDYDLSLSNLSVPSGFAITEGISAILASGNSDTFTIELLTSSVGVKNGLVSFDINDTDDNTFSFSITGEVTPAPEITVKGNGILITDGDTTPSLSDHTDFGVAALGGTTVSRTFTVTNDGTATLTLSNLSVPSGFTVTEGLVASLGVGASDTFTVRLDTLAAGDKNGPITFDTNDSDENPFNFDIVGQVLAPPVVVVNSLTTNDQTPLISGTISHGTLEVTVNGVTYPVGSDLIVNGNDWTLQIPAGDVLSEGTYSVTATSTDAAANVASDGTSDELIIDLTAPTVAVNSQTTSHTTPLITGTVSDGALEVTVNSITYTVGSDLVVNGTDWTLQIPVGNALAEGTYEVSATSTDTAGNVGSDQTNNELIIDTTAPVVQSMTPIDNATDVAVDTSLTLVFDETVVKGASGSVTVKRSSDNAEFASIDVTTAQVSVSGATVTINLGSDLEHSTDYYVLIDAGALVDAAGNGFGGIATATTWNFTTVPVNNAAPLLQDADHSLGEILEDPVSFAGVSVSDIVADGAITDPNVPLFLTFEAGISSTGAVTIRQYDPVAFAWDDNDNQNDSPQVIIGFNEPSASNTLREKLRGLFEFDLSTLVNQVGGQPFNVDGVSFVLHRAAKGDISGTGYNHQNLTLDAYLYGFDFDEGAATWAHPSATNGDPNG
ncbi:MAG: choice-of-anchor D domain-containing protein, partial [Planctomycetaceae bacterium]|nr:choice-of-anchor D domain-containing protein [Planctomycetaceae bacterium]